MPKIAVIVGSVRPGRVTREVADWVHTVASKRPEADYELVDIADFDLLGLRRGAAAAVRAVRGCAHQALGSEDRRVRRLRLRHPRVQPQRSRGAEERARLHLRRVEQQGRGLRQHRRRGRRARGRAPAADRLRTADRDRAGAARAARLGRLPELPRLLPVGNPRGGAGPGARPARELGRRTEGSSRLTVRHTPYSHRTMVPPAPVAGGNSLRASQNPRRRASIGVSGDRSGDAGGDSP